VSLNDIENQALNQGVKFSLEEKEILKELFGVSNQNDSKIPFEKFYSALKEI
jgi:hypothetical protein